MSPVPELSQAQIDLIIGMAWSDRVTFEEIEEKTGLTEGDVIYLMRRELKPSSFRLWRKRVTGRMTKHRRLFRKSREALKDGREPVETT